MNTIKNRGVSIEVFRELRKEFLKVKDRTKKGSRKLTFGERLVEFVVKPATNNAKVSYVELLASREESKDFVGTCNVFVSHAWKYDFEELVDALEEFEQLAVKKIYYFCDYFAVNQHKPTEDLKFLEEMAVTCDTFLLVLWPWQNPLPLKRAWCILEIANAIKSDCEFKVTLSPSQVESFNNCLLESPTKIINTFRNLDSSKAEASVERDLDMIRTKIQNDLGGFKAVNEMAGGRLREWLLGVVLKTSKNWPEAEAETMQHAEFLYQAGHFCRDQGKYERARMLQSQSVEMNVKLWGGTHPLTLQGKICLANTLKLGGWLEEAYDLHSRTLEAQKETLGEMDQDTLDSQQGLADTARKLGRLDEAYRIQAYVSKSMTKKLGTTHKYTLEAEHFFGEILQDQNKLEEALSKFQEVYQRRMEHNELGVDHPETLATRFWLGSTHVKLGNWQKGVEILEETHQEQVKVIGTDHPDTLRTHRVLTDARLKAGEDANKRSCCVVL